MNMNMNRKKTTAEKKLSANVQKENIQSVLENNPLRAEKYKTWIINAFALG